MIKQIKNKATEPSIPRTVEEAAQMLLSEFLIQHLQDLASMTENDFDQLCRSLTPYVNSEFKIWQGNNALMASCQAHSDDLQDDPARIIINRLREILQDFHGMFIIT